MQDAVAKTNYKDAPGQSPFRYPGGKAWLTQYLAGQLAEKFPEGGTYIEPFAGGAGAAIRLLADGVATEIHLNDADPRVFNAWKALLSENARFLDCLEKSQTNMATWWEYKRIVDDPSLATDSFELGFATFYLNRTNRSGIVQGAAPIGGYHQSGDWKLDARYYRATLSNRISWLGRNADKIKITNLDGLTFLKGCAETYADALYFVDPPYVSAGSRLYMNGMTNTDHKALADFLCSNRLSNWIVTYDDCDLIRQLYRDAHITELDVRYSLQRKRNDNELIILPIKRLSQ